MQEALTNVVKHAGASRVTVAVIEDDATSSSASPTTAPASTDASSEGFGLIGMRERLALVNGTLRVESSPGAGTVLHASIPARRGAVA